MLNKTVLTPNSTMPPLRNPFGGEIGYEAVDAGYVIIVTFIIFTMQSGFGLLESGIKIYWLVSS